MRAALKLIFLAALIVAGGYGVWRYESGRSVERKLNAQIKELESQRQHLQEFVQRLTSHKRIAEIVVTEQARKDGQIESTTLMFVEYARDGSRLPPRFFTIRGNVAHIDMLVIQFNKDFIEKNDPLRGHSIAIFHRIFGDYQTPAEGYRIDEPNRPPVVYREDGLPESARAFEADLWRQFWELADNPKLRAEKGVEVAQGESPWTYFYPDRLYTVSQTAPHGVTIVSTPLDGLLKDVVSAMKRHK